MSDYHMGIAEAHFADIIWENEPISSSELAVLSENRFNWKKSTTYTVLKRLCDKGLFINNKGTVTSLVSREEFYCARSEQFIVENFNGSLPAFLAAFTTRKALTDEEVKELRRLIAQYEED